MKTSIEFCYAREPLWAPRLYLSFLFLPKPGYFNSNYLKGMSPVYSSLKSKVPPISALLLESGLIITAVQRIKYARKTSLHWSKSILRKPVLP